MDRSGVGVQRLWYIWQPWLPTCCQSLQHLHPRVLHWQLQPLLLHSDTILKTEQCRRLGSLRKDEMKNSVRGRAGQWPALLLTNTESGPLHTLRKETDEEYQQHAPKPSPWYKHNFVCVLGVGNGIHVEFVASGGFEPTWINYLNKTDKVGWLYKEDKVTSKYF